MDCEGVYLEDGKWNKVRQIPGVMRQEIAREEVGHHLRNEVLHMCPTHSKEI